MTLSRATTARVSSTLCAGPTAPRGGHKKQGSRGPAGYPLTAAHRVCCTRAARAPARDAGAIHNTGKLPPAAHPVTGLGPVPAASGGPLPFGLALRTLQSSPGRLLAPRGQPPALTGVETRRGDGATYRAQAATEPPVRRAALPANPVQSQSQIQQQVPGELSFQRALVGTSPLARWPAGRPTQGAQELRARGAAWARGRNPL